jgi:hypothetical protein
MIPIHGLTVFLLESKELTFLRRLPIGLIPMEELGDQCKSSLYSSFPRYSTLHRRAGKNDGLNCTIVEPFHYLS